MMDLVTGGAGFIGSHLVEKINDCLIVDDLRTGKKIEGKKILKGDVVGVKEVGKVERIFHLAAISRVGEAMKNPEETIRVNVTGTLNMLEIARKQDAKFLFASSREVYGDQKKFPVKEDAEKMPKNLYGLSKLIGEKLCELYQREYGVDVKIVRYSNIYGPLDKGRVIPTFVEKAVKGETIKVYGKNKVLDFLHVDDAVEATLIVAKKGEGVYNIGSGKGITLGGLARKIVEIVGSKSGVGFERGPEYEVNKFVADISRIKELGWKPKIDLETGLKMMIGGRV